MEMAPNWTIFRISHHQQGCWMSRQWKLTDAKSRKDGQATFEDDEFAGHLEALQAFQVTLLNTLQAAGQAAFMCRMNTFKAFKS